MNDTDRLATIEIDDANLPFASKEVQQERQVAIYDILQENSFAIPDRGDRSAPSGPYNLHLGMLESRVVFKIGSDEHKQIVEFQISLVPLRGVIKDYFRICTSYYSAVKSYPRHQIEAIDMARRGIHDEGSRLLQEKLAGKIAVDTDTARRLFTLVCVLQTYR